MRCSPTGGYALLPLVAGSSECRRTIKTSTDYIVANKLGGAMVWDVSNDDGSLLSTVYYRFYSQPMMGRP